LKQFLIASVFSVALAAVGSATAQDEALPASVSEAYLAYETAMGSRDYTAAADAAETAWREAKRERINPDLVGVLAANFGELAESLGRFDDAYEAWREAADIADRLSLSAEERANRWHHASMAAFLADDVTDARRCAENASEALIEADLSVFPAQMLDNHYSVGARANQRAGRHDTAGDYARAGLALINSRAGARDRAFADLTFVTALDSFTDHDWVDAALAFRRAAYVYADADSSDLALVSTSLAGLTWRQMDEGEQRAYIRGMQGSDHPNPRYWHPDSTADSPHIVSMPRPVVESTDYEEGQDGFVHIAYTFGADGEMAERHVIETTMDRSVTTDALETLDTWWIDVEAGLPPDLASGEVSFEYRSRLLRAPDSDLPIAIRRVQPQYPQRALEDGQEGLSVVGFDIDDEGRIENARVLVSMPSGVFDEVSLEAVNGWEYPPLREGETLEARTGMSTEFHFMFAD
jgi:TonB family protein